MKRRKQIGLLLLMLTSYTAAQTPAVGTVQVEKLQVLRDGGDVRVEVTLSAQTSPSVEIASNPDRLVIVLPNTISDAKQQRASRPTAGRPLLHSDALFADQWAGPL